ncbi:MAG: RHS repeat domain-containing protein, partial [Terriglobales bacterium]
DTHRFRTPITFSAREQDLACPFAKQSSNSMVAPSLYRAHQEKGHHSGFACRETKFGPSEFVNDVTDSVALNAENRLIKITYQGTNNFTDFSYDPYGRNVMIVETTAGSVTSTTQFVWSGHSRRESRDGSSALISQFFPLGQIDGSTKRYYCLNHNGSITEVTDSFGAIVGQQTFDGFGRPTQLQGSYVPDFGFAEYYLHSRSGLNITFTRAYNPVSGRWINRDKIAESGGSNLYAYVGNNPITYFDPGGLDRMRVGTPPGMENRDPKSPIGQMNPDPNNPFPGPWEQWPLYDPDTPTKYIWIPQGYDWGAIDKAAQGRLPIADMPFLKEQFAKGESGKPNSGGPWNYHKEYDKCGGMTPRAISRLNNFMFGYLMGKMGRSWNYTYGIASGGQIIGPNPQLGDTKDDIPWVQAGWRAGSGLITAPWKN